MDNTNNTGNLNLIYTNNGTTSTIILPLDLYWKPQEDITIYELSLCIPFLIRPRSILPYEFDKNAPYARHWEMRDPNNYIKTTN